MENDHFLWNLQLSMDMFLCFLYVYQRVAFEWQSDPSQYDVIGYIASGGALFHGHISYGVANVDLISENHHGCLTIITTSLQRHYKLWVVSLSPSAFFPRFH